MLLVLDLRSFQGETQNRPHLASIGMSSRSEGGSFDEQGNLLEEAHLGLPKNSRSLHRPLESLKLTRRTR